MKREYASDPQSEEQQGQRYSRKQKLYPPRPFTAIEALMQCAPGREPDKSVEELLPLRDIIQDAIDSLPELHRWVFDEVVVGRASLRSLGRPKTSIARWRDEAIEKLQRQLLRSPEIRDYLGIEDDY